MIVVVIINYVVRSGQILQFTPHTAENVTRLGMKKRAKRGKKRRAKRGKGRKDSVRKQAWFNCILNSPTSTSRQYIALTSRHGQQILLYIIKHIYVALIWKEEM